MPAPAPARNPGGFRSAKELEALTGADIDSATPPEAPASRTKVVMTDPGEPLRPKIAPAPAGSDPKDPKAFEQALLFNVNEAERRKQTMDQRRHAFLGRAQPYFERNFERLQKMQADRRSRLFLVAEQFRKEAEETRLSRVRDWWQSLDPGRQLLLSGGLRKSAGLPVMTTIGGLTGLAHGALAEKVPGEDRTQRIAKSTLIGAGTGLGADIGAILGAMAGIAIMRKTHPNAGGVTGAIAGGLAGGGLGFGLGHALLGRKKLPPVALEPKKA